MASVVRRICTGGKPGPFDVSVFPAISVRLYPTTNRCERRAMIGPKLFDLEERQALSETLQASTSDPFIFLDLGANVGLYSLWLVSEARRLDRRVRVLAVEPDPTTAARLIANIEASNATEIEHAACAIGATRGIGHMVEKARNRGENRVVAHDDGADYAVSFDIVPIPDICDRHAIVSVDAMKIDLEGADHDALIGLFASGRSELYPQLLIVEAGDEEAEPPLIRLCFDHGYALKERTRLNAILERTSVAVPGRNAAGGLNTAGEAIHG